jgi:hypothetical protein
VAIFEANRKIKHCPSKSGLLNKEILELKKIPRFAIKASPLIPAIAVRFARPENESQLF